jgi:hypothetical protein
MMIARSARALSQAAASRAMSSGAAAVPEIRKVRGSQKWMSPPPQARERRLASLALA